MAKGTFTSEEDGEVIATGENVIADADVIADEIEYTPMLKVVSDDEPEDEEFEFEMPELTPEIMMKMFANMDANGAVRMTTAQGWAFSFSLALADLTVSIAGCR